MAAKDKDTIYIDIDDEITGIIDKVKDGQGKVVALVLPKRASVFQSIVNMKLLKRAGDEADKNLVLITSEAGLLPLAGAAGIYVAKTLNSKPEIPLAPQGMEDTEEAITEDAEPTVGQLAGDTPPPPPADGGVETLMLDDEDVPPEAAAAAPNAAKEAANAAKAAKGKKGKKFKIPNFDRFRKLIIIAAIVFALVIGFLIYATFALPKATIKIKTDATSIETNLDLNLATAATSLDPATNTLPAKYVSQQKTYSQQVPTTGQKNNGNKATGSITMTATETTTTPPADIPAGTGVSSNGQTYITQRNTSFSADGHNNGHGSISYAATSSTPITAQSGGSSFNVSGVSFTVANRSDVSATGSASGGTDNIVQTVNQNDINNAKNKITTDDKAIKQNLKEQLEDQKQYAIEATYTAGTPNVQTSAKVGDQASSVTVSQVITYSMFGVNKDDLNDIIENGVKSQIDTSNRSVLDTGLDDATFNVNTISSTNAQLSLSTKAVVGPALDTDAIKRASAGKRAGEIKAMVSNNPDVTGVDVSISPFWVNKAPKKTDRIIVKIAKPTTTKASSSNGDNP